MHKNRMRIVEDLTPLFLISGMNESEIKCKTFVYTVQ